MLRNVRKEHLQGHVRKHVALDSNVHTDALASYEGLHGEYVHTVVDHAECYVDGNVHTNGCENYWSLLKRSIKGTYVSVDRFTCSGIWTNRRSGSTIVQITTRDDSTQRLTASLAVV